MMTSEFLCTTLQILFNQNTGTAFTAQNAKNTKQFLITARHIFQNISNNEIIDIGIRRVSNWVTIRCRVYFPEKDSIDIAVLELIDIPYLTKAFSRDLSFDSAVLGQDMYFLGFPFGLYMDCDQSLNDGFPLPLVKKSCLSLIRSQNDEGLLILDGINNLGFSGGPVCFIDVATSRRKIGAVISGYRANKSTVFHTMATEKTPYVLENTGLILAYNIKWATDIINTF